MKYANFIIKTPLGDITEFDKNPCVKRDTVKIGEFTLRLSEVKNVVVVHSQKLIVIDLVDGPPSNLPISSQKEVMAEMVSALNF